MADLYQILGIRRSASKAAIRAAYRKRSKQEHPDAGGTEEGFALLKLAHDVLCDPARREQYDKTGKYQEVGPDNSDAAVYGVLAQALGQVLAQVVKQNQSPAQIDMTALIRQRIEVMRAEQDQIIAQLCENSVVLKRLVGRFKVKKGGSNPLETIISAQLVGVQEQVERLKRHAVILASAAEVAAIVSFTQDVAEPQVLVRMTAGTWASFRFA